MISRPMTADRLFPFRVFSLSPRSSWADLLHTTTIPERSRYKTPSSKDPMSTSSLAVLSLTSVRAASSLWFSLTMVLVYSKEMEFTTSFDIPQVSTISMRVERSSGLSPMLIILPISGGTR